MYCSTAYWMQPRAQGSIISAQPFYEQASPQNMALVSLTRAKTQLKCDFLFNLHSTVLILWCYGESSLRMSSWYVSPLFLYDPSNLHLSPQNYFNRSCFFRIILLIYFLRTPLGGLALYSFNYPLCLLLSYLNYAFVYFNEIKLLLILCILYML